MTFLKNFWDFWYDFIVGDDWRIAVGVVAALAVLAWTHFRESPVVARRARFDISTPQGTTLGTSMAVSPDGTQVVISATSGSVARLFLRSLDSGDTRPLAPGESVDTPGFFWSPDSRFVAFVAGGILKKVEVATGAVQNICPLPSNATFRGGAWNTRGVILIGINGLGLMRVPEGGGTPALLFDLEGRKLYALGGIFTARDTIFLLFILLFLAFSLFFFTSLFGRLWCG